MSSNPDRVRALERKLDIQQRNIKRYQRPPEANSAIALQELALRQHFARSRANNLAGELVRDED